MKTILITGGTGFIGSHTCLLLLERGFDLIIIDSYINSSPKNLKGALNKINSNFDNKITFVKGDIRDQSSLEDIFIESKNIDKPISAVIHFAGLKSVAESVEKPLLYWDVNVKGSISLFNAMQNNNCRTIVFSSSATIYGKATKSPFSEDSQISPLNPYGQTKAAVEKLLCDVYASQPNSWRVANLRYFNPVGAHPSGLIGEDPLGIPNNLFPYICQVAIGRRKELKIFGNNWPTSDGTGVRDYIHVMDLADGHLAALQYLFSEEPQLLNLNLGTGKGTSVLELINTFMKVNQCDIPYVFTNRRSGDVSTTVADNKLAKQKLGWEPHRKVEDMCRDGWLWQQRSFGEQ
tara:strand:- start:140 stop:1183 length:1044 start_codon:yes stop_codon:yes gene_type:complete